MQQIYRRTPLPKCDFNKVAKQLLGGCFSFSFTGFRTVYTLSVPQPWCCYCCCFKNLLFATFTMVSRKIAPRLGLGFGSRLGLVLGLGDNQANAPEENCFPRLGLVLGLGGNFPRGQLFWNPSWYTLLSKNILKNVIIILLSRKKRPFFNEITSFFSLIINFISITEVMVISPLLTAQFPFHFALIL